MAILTKRLKAKRLTAVMLIILAGLIVYLNSFKGVFLFDDLDLIVNNPKVQTLLPLTEKFGIANRENVFLTFAVSCFINRMIGLESFNVFGFHLVNVIIHILTGLCLFGIVRLTLLLPIMSKRYQTVSTELAMISALIWIVHPMHTQAVTYIIQRMESQMALCYLFSIYCFVKSLFSRKPMPWHLLGIASCLFGIGSKESMITLPGVILLYDRTFSSQTFLRAVKKHWFLYLGLVLCGSGVVYQVYFQQSATQTAAMKYRSRLREIEKHELQSQDRQPELLKALPKSEWSLPEAHGDMRRDIPHWKYLITMAKVQTYYLRLALWPSQLCLDYMWRPVQTIREGLFSALFLSAMIILTIILIYRNTPAGFMLGSFFIFLSPRLVVPVREFLYEHHMYLPLTVIATGCVLCVFLMGSHIINHRIGNTTLLRNIGTGIGRFTALVIIVFLGLTTIHRNRDYEDLVQFWKSNVDIRPENPRAQSNLGCALVAKGMLLEALPHLQTAVDLKPDYIQARCNLGSIYAQLGYKEKALEHLKIAAQQNPDHPGIQSNLGNIYVDLGQFEKAVACFEKALSINPDFDVARMNLKRARTMAAHQK